MKRQISIRLCLLALMLSAAFGCKTEQKNPHLSHMVASEGVAKPNQPDLPVFGNLVEVKTTGMNFILPEEIPSGWTTFRYSNVSPVTHFMLIDKLPEVQGDQKTLQDLKEVQVIFADALEYINKGEPEKGFAEFTRFPAWYSEVVFSGGVGLVSPGETAQTTVYLEPGTYVIECYVKTGQVFHPMAKQVVIKESSNFEEPPVATSRITVSKEGGIEMAEIPKAGPQVFAIDYLDQEPHEHGLGHDIHLVKLTPETNLDTLASWMNWATPWGLNTPAPAVFLGGAQEMASGSTAYLSVDLQPGRYAWIAEVPDPDKKNMLKTFRIRN